MSVAVRQDPHLLNSIRPWFGRDGVSRSDRQISSIVEAPVLKTPLKYWITLSITGSVTVLLLSMLTYLAVTGIGVWGSLDGLDGVVGCAGQSAEVVVNLGG